MVPHLSHSVCCILAPFIDPDEEFSFTIQAEVSYVLTHGTEHMMIRHIGPGNQLVTPVAGFTHGYSVSGMTRRCVVGGIRTLTVVGISTTEVVVVLSATVLVVVAATEVDVDVSTTEVVVVLWGGGGGA
jgi:hypothetical protein